MKRMSQTAGKLVYNSKSFKTKCEKCDIETGFIFLDLRDFLFPMFTSVLTLFLFYYLVKILTLFTLIILDARLKKIE